MLPFRMLFFSLAILFVEALDSSHHCLSVNNIYKTIHRFLKKFHDLNFFHIVKKNHAPTCHDKTPTRFTEHSFITLFRFLCLSYFMNSTVRAASYQFPSTEFNALQDLYNSANGENWRWAFPYAFYGYAWNFTAIPIENPCSSSRPWQGVKCTSDCNHSPCYTEELTLSSLNLKGALSLVLSKQKLIFFIRRNNKQLSNCPHSLNKIRFIRK